MRDLFRKDFSGFYTTFLGVPLGSSSSALVIFLILGEAEGPVNVPFPKKVNSFQTGEPYEVVGC